MTQPASVGLKYGFLIVLYLFLVWVAFSALRDLRRGRRGAGGPSYSEYEPSADATGMYDAVSGPLDASGFEPRLLVERAVGHESGIAYDLSEPVTLGRGDVEIRLEDPFASSQHVRISREGHTVVIEDLGSTNGTFLNDSPLTGPQPLHDGDRVRIGDSEFQYLQ
jgi:hypothetical protein